MIFSSLCFVFFIRKAPRFNFRAFQIMAGRDYWEQVNAYPPVTAISINLFEQNKAFNPTRAT
jgi:hypothetical protein